jgi:CheY-like chemotaxis protein
MNSKRPILLVEDDTIDAITVQRALKELNILNQLVIMTNGEEALRYLSENLDAIPCIILLDLNMPKMNGVEFLQARNQIEFMRFIPVVVLTTSLDEKDRLETFKLGISGYMLKPVDYKQFVEVVRTIDLYWTLSALPFNE